MRRPAPPDQRRPPVARAVAEAREILDRPERAGLPLDEWGENLPFRETRRYVKAAVADAGVYRWLYQGDDLRIDGLVRMPAPGPGVAF